MLRLRDRLYGIYAEATGKDTAQIEADCDRNKWLDDKEMLEYGLIDKVLNHLPKNPRAKPPSTRQPHTDAVPCAHEHRVTVSSTDSASKKAARTSSSAHGRHDQAPRPARRARLTPALGPDGIWYAYAQWPSAEARSKASMAARGRRSVGRCELTEGSFPEIVLEPVADYLVHTRDG